MNSTEQMLHIITKGFDLLVDKESYQQVDVLKKLDALNYGISSASLSNILNPEKSVGVKTLSIASKGIQAIVEAEIGQAYNRTTNKFEPIPAWEKVSIPTEEIKAKEHAYTFHDKGRLRIEEKVDFINDAYKEVVEVGVRLRTFTNYFHSRADYEFKKPIKELLKKGVNIKIYLVNPNSQEARIYFEDRAKVQASESNSLEIIQQVIVDLNHIRDELQSYNYKGKFEIYTYRHIPYCHFLIVDGSTQRAKMVVSNYLYGLKRADSPVIEISLRDNPDLYKKYYTSYQSLVKDAHQL